MKLERVDRQTVPLIEGRFYLVPTVRAKWYSKLADWPVIGALHEDREIFDFPSTIFISIRGFCRRGIVT